MEEEESDGKVESTPVTHCPCYLNAFVAPPGGSHCEGSFPRMAGLVAEITYGEMNIQLFLLSDNPLEVICRLDCKG